MNIYFLVEGRSTEKKLYTAWLNYLIPELQRVNFYDQIAQNNYVIISGNGYPSILDEGIPNAIDKIQEVPKYNYLVICLDADEDTVEEREKYVNDFIKENIAIPASLEIVIIIQNRCIETWLLGNRKIFNYRQPLQRLLADYVQYYDVSQNDPELMGKFKQKNHADFHLVYLQEIFRAKNLSYSKKFPGETQEEYYLQQLIKRIDETEHLKTFQKFINFCDNIRQNLR
jgi:hypothetical protein